MHFATAAAKLSAMLDNLLTTKESTETKPLENLPQTEDAIDPVTESLLLQELETFIDRKSQLSAHPSSGATPEAFCPPQNQPQPDGALLHSLTTLIKAGMERCEPDLHGPAASLSSVAIATDRRLERLVSHHDTFVAGLRKLMLARKACYAELDALARLHSANAVSTLQDKNSHGNKTTTENESSATTYWAARETELQAQLLATERLHRTITSHVKLVQNYTDSIMLEVMPPVIG